MTKYQIFCCPLATSVGYVLQYVLLILLQYDSGSVCPLRYLDSLLSLPRF
jgi:hypothetical protein